MKNRKVIFWLLIAVFVSFVVTCIYRQKAGCGKCSEKYGQDPSIRASVGWIAGNGMYGYDPITEYADQIAEMTREKRLARMHHSS